MNLRFQPTLGSLPRVPRRARTQGLRARAAGAGRCELPASCGARPDCKTPVCRSFCLPINGESARHYQCHPGTISATPFLGPPPPFLASTKSDRIAAEIRVIAETLKFALPRTLPRTWSVPWSWSLCKLARRLHNSWRLLLLARSVSHVHRMQQAETRRETLPLASTRGSLTAAAQRTMT